MSDTGSANYRQYYDRKRVNRSSGSQACPSRALTGIVEDDLGYCGSRRRETGDVRDQAAASYNPMVQLESPPPAANSRCWGLSDSLCRRPTRRVSLSGTTPAAAVVCAAVQLTFPVDLRRSLGGAAGLRGDMTTRACAGQRSMATQAAGSTSAVDSSPNDAVIAAYGSSTRPAGDHPGLAVGSAPRT